MVLVWSLVLCFAPMSSAETWTVEQLIENIAKHRQAEARFEETAFSSLLTEPLKTQGTLRFTPPSRLEKHVTVPYDERYIIEGDKVLFERKSQGIHRTLSLQDYPVLHAFVEAFRSVLANDVTTLRRFYNLDSQGVPQRWVLHLRPRDKAVQELVESIQFSGEGEQVRSIEVLAPDGDRSVMVIRNDAS